MRLRMLWQLPLSVALAAAAVLALGLEPHTAPAVFLAAVTPELTRVDLSEHRLPNRLLVPGLLVGVAAAAGSWIVTGAAPLVPLAAALAVGGILLLLGLSGAIGMGDVKLAALLGLASPTLGIAVLSPVTAFLFGGFASIVVLVRRGRGARLAFGPALLAGYWVVLVLIVVFSRR